MPIVLEERRGGKRMKDLIKVSFPPIDLIIFLMCEDYGCVNNHYLTFGRKWWVMGVGEI